MSLLDKLSSAEEWNAFLSYKLEGGHLTAREEKELRGFIENKLYEEPAHRIQSGGGLSAPQKKLIRKSGSAKKRTVYIFPNDESAVLKLLTFLLLREYDGIFSDNLYSFRASSGAHKAVRRALSQPDINKKFTYKADISNYFNSIDIRLLLGMLAGVFAEDAPLLSFFEAVLTDDRAFDGDSLITEEKGAMAGAAFAVFLANVYLSGLDRRAEHTGLCYFRYSDDIMVFADSAEERDSAAAFIRGYIENMHLAINPEKEIYTSPGEAWSFLGIKYDGVNVDISSVSKEKLKGKIRRKARALKRWQAKKGATNEQTIRAFIRSMNSKFFAAELSSELTWCRWYFPLITTDRTLKEIDAYMQQWIRYLSTGKHTKANYSFRYEKMKQLGYVSLVHTWYEYKKGLNS